MNNWLAVALLGVLCGSGPSAKAQETSTPRNETMQPGIPALSKGTWELGVFGGGGVVASLAPDTKFLVVGGRLGPHYNRGSFSRMAARQLRNCRGTHACVCRFYSGEEHLRRERESHPGSVELYGEPSSSAIPARSWRDSLQYIERSARRFLQN